MVIDSRAVTSSAILRHSRDDVLVTYYSGCQVKFAGIYSSVISCASKRREHEEKSISDMEEHGHWGTTNMSSFQQFMYVADSKAEHLQKQQISKNNYYRSMHFSAKRGLAIACRPSVCPSVSELLKLVICDHIGWKS